MTRPRPSRKARWATGLSLVTLFALVTFGATLVAVLQVTDGLDTSGSFADEPQGWADATAEATILDVDVYDLDDEKQSVFFDREGGDAGYAEVDIQFTNGGGSLDGSTVSVAWMSWPDNLELPDVGDQVQIEYNARDPEYRPELAGTADGRPAVGIVRQTSPAAPAAPFEAASVNGQNEPGHVTASVRWTIAVSGLLTLLTLVATVIWARRAEPAEGTGVPPGGWSQPWGQAGWEPGRQPAYSQPYQQSGWQQQPQYPPQPYSQPPGQQPATPQYQPQPSLPAGPQQPTQPTQQTQPTQAPQPQPQPQPQPPADPPAGWLTPPG